MMSTANAAFCRFFIWKNWNLIKEFFCLFLSPNSFPKRDGQKQLFQNRKHKSFVGFVLKSDRCFLEWSVDENQIIYQIVYTKSYTQSSELRRRRTTNRLIHKSHPFIRTDYTQSIFIQRHDTTHTICKTHVLCVIVSLKSQKHWFVFIVPFTQNIWYIQSGSEDANRAEACVFYFKMFATYNVYARKRKI